MSAKCKDQHHRADELHSSASRSFDSPCGYTSRYLGPIAEVFKRIGGLFSRLEDRGRAGGQGTGQKTLLAQKAYSSLQAPLVATVPIVCLVCTVVKSARKRFTQKFQKFGKNGV